MIHVKVPATTANMGPGFDSIGMALQLYNQVWAEEIESGLEIKVKRQQKIPIPTNEKNLIYRTVLKFYQQNNLQMPGLRLVQEDRIPLTRGLGSSAACIVAGLLIANTLSGKNYPVEELVRIAAIMEGHPDNSTPALIGGMVVGALEKDRVNYVKIPVPEDLDFYVMIPNFPLSTDKARGILPKEVALKDAVFNASRTGLLVASMMQRQYDNLWMAMDDCLHQPYRKKIIPDLEGIFQKAGEYDGKAAFLSGAGPTIIAVAHKNPAFFSKMEDYLSTKGGKWNIKQIKPDLKGAEVTML